MAHFRLRKRGALWKIFCFKGQKLQLCAWGRSRLFEWDLAQWAYISSSCLKKDPLAWIFESDLTEEALRGRNPLAWVFVKSPVDRLWPETQLERFLRKNSGCMTTCRGDFLGWSLSLDDYAPTCLQQAPLLQEQRKKLAMALKRHTLETVQPHMMLTC